jgi:hypothetical protein
MSQLTSIIWHLQWKFLKNVIPGLKIMRLLTVPGPCGSGSAKLARILVIPFHFSSTDVTFAGLFWPYDLSRAEKYIQSHLLASIDLTTSAELKNTHSHICWPPLTLRPQQSWKIHTVTFAGLHWPYDLSRAEKYTQSHLLASIDLTTSAELKNTYSHICWPLLTLRPQQSWKIHTVHIVSLHKKLIGIKSINSR